jgi:hypothetical protein
VGQIKWQPAWLTDSTFQSYLKLHVTQTDYEGHDMPIAKYALVCIRCRNLKHLEACPNCGNEAYRLGHDREFQSGLFCPRCKRGFTTWSCVCGCDNPVSFQTVFTSKKEGCFVATICCGSEVAPEVRYLSEFRDRALLPHAWGRAVVRTYYFLSPALVAVLRRNRHLRRAIRTTAIRPVVRLLGRMERVGCLRCTMGVRRSTEAASLHGITSVRSSRGDNA